MTDHMDAALAVRVLSECDLLGWDDLADQCELFAAEHFDECVQIEMFDNLSPSQLGRLLKHSRLNVSSEEVVLQAVLKWQRARRGRDIHMGLLLHYVRFPLLSLTSLHALGRYSQGVGPWVPTFKESHCEA